MSMSHYDGHNICQGALKKDINMSGMTEDGCDICQRPITYFGCKLGTSESTKYSWKIQNIGETRYIW